MNEKASAGLRIIAALFDYLLLWAVYLLLLLLLVSAGDITQLLDRLAFTMVSVILISLLGAPIYSVFLTSLFGGTVGKLIAGLEVVDSQGKRISVGRAFFRNYIGYIVSGLFFWLGFIWIAVDRDRRGWHDMIADTLVVVKNRSGAVLGIVALAFVLGANVLLTIHIVQQLRVHQSLYQEIASEITTELKTVTEEDSAPSPQPFTSPPPLL